MKTKIFKLFITLFLLLLVSINVKAQYVEVQDPNFRAWLQEAYPGCFDGDMLDTTCSSIVNETTVLLPEQTTLELYNIKEIQYFDSLKRFYVNYNLINFIERFPSRLNNIGFYALANLTSIPALPVGLDSLKLAATSIQSITGEFPQGLKSLDIFTSPITYIPTIPTSVKFLNISQNYFLTNTESIVSNLHEGIESLDISYLGLNNIPNLPSTLIYLNCSGNNISEIPLNLPNSLTSLYISQNQLSGPLLNIPANVVFLDVSVNQLTSIPPLNQLNFLNCSYNNIDTLDITSELFLSLICNNNQLTHITGDFSHLSYLDCSFNQLNNINLIENSILSYLNCSNNQITCLPILPQTLWWANQFNVSSNNIHCLQNYVHAMSQEFINTYPLCVLGDTINNPNFCSNAYGVIGRVYEDINNNCQSDIDDTGLSNIKVNYFNAINNDFSMTYSNYGIFNNSLTPSMYFISIDTLDSPYIIDCPYPGIDTLIQTTTTNPLISNINFSITCKNGVDVGVQSVSSPYGLPFPGQVHEINIKAGDLSQLYNLNCAAGVGGTVSVNLSGPVSFYSISNGGLTPQVNGNNLFYAIDDFSQINTNTSFGFKLLTDTTAQINEMICIETIITADTIENNYLNNNKSFCYPVVNSYDPNMKMVFPVNVEPGYDDWLTYTIYFQNLGNAPAFDIRILDTLDNNLRHETFQLTAYSHFNTVTMNNGILTFRFPNIMLPDSASNPEGSIGFIQYRIKPNSNLPVGTQIENTAHIYFDFNPAIVTNTTINEFVVPTEVKPKTISKYSLWPNPAKNLLYFKSEEAIYEVKIFDVTGKQVLQQQTQFPINIDNLVNGIYFLQVNNSMNFKFVKQ